MRRLSIPQLNFTFLTRHSLGHLQVMPLLFVLTTFYVFFLPQSKLSQLLTLGLHALDLMELCPRTLIEELHIQLMSHHRNLDLFSLLLPILLLPLMLVFLE